MSITEPPLTVINKFNRGEVDDGVLAREDVTKIVNSAALVENWIPFRLGGMMHPPGTEDLGALKADGVLLPFVFAIDDTALVEVTTDCLRFWVDDEVVTRPTPSTSVGAMNTWTDASGAGSSVTFSGASNKANLLAADTTEAILRTSVATATGEHGLRIVVERGPVRLQLGDTGTGSTNIYDGVLGTGTHSLSVSPTSSLSITLRSDLNYTVVVESVAFEALGTLEVPATISDPESVRWHQAADIFYCAQDGPLFKIERRGTKSWSWVKYETQYGPFGFINTSQITMTVSALGGNPTVTASADYFTDDMVGSLLRLASGSQNVSSTVTAASSATGSIRVTGVDTSRAFGVSVTGAITAGGVELQRSADDASWETVETYTSSTSKAFDDELDNSVLYYRLTTDATFTGSVTLSLNYASGSIEGIGRIYTVLSATQARVSTLVEFGSTDATRDWYRSVWSEEDGFPTSVVIDEGRLCLAGKGEFHASESALYENFDREVEGNSRAILRTIGFGPSDKIHWLASAVRLVMGLTSDEISVRSSSFGELLTQDNAVLRPGTMEGAAPVPPVMMNNALYFADRTERKMIEMVYNVSNDSYAPFDLNYLAETICEGGIHRVAMLKKPEPRLLVVLKTGEVRILMIDRNEDVLCWSRRTFPYPCVDVVVLPELDEDRAYFVLNVNGTYRLQKMAKFDEAHLYPVDMYGTLLFELDHLIGETVDVWVDGTRASAAEVVGSDGDVTTQAGTVICAGKRITARWKSGKLGQYVENSVLNQRKNVLGIGIIARNLWHDGFKHGMSESKLYNLPKIYKGAALDTTQLIDEYDVSPSEFEGSPDSDSRIWLVADGPAKIMSIGYSIDEITDQARERG